MHSSSPEFSAALGRASEHLRSVRTEMAKVIVGQQDLIHRLLVCLVARGHVLLEGLPGLAKTATVNALARATHCQFSRIQFTPDLLPGDITGSLIYDPLKGTYSTRTGPIFANLILADEINRAPSKVQSALLEAMQERQVTIGDKTWPLPDPFLVLATQNPIEQEGTYPLPEAQMDRFMLKVIVGYPSAEEELLILDRMATTKPSFALDAVVSPDELRGYQDLVNRVHVDALVRDYIVRLVVSTREAAQGRGVAPDLKRMVRIGASPRATINLALAARACALMEGRDHVTPDHVKLIAPDVLRHRILITYEAEAEEVSTESIVRTLLEKVKVP
ncbi:MAG TPA: MoxR family ATPase [Candidatus Limnocylindria bacterium]|jgi:MoxR-like ATPase|nr:MoxR family ATPase [Candidatus Limnocylindria bacterium]